MRPTSVTVSATGNSNWIPVDYTQNNFKLGIQVTVSAGASLTWVVQMTSDDVFDPSVTPVVITAPDPLNTGTGNEIGSITTPIRAVRLNATITGGNVTMTVIQGSSANWMLVGATGGTLVTWNDDATALLKPDGTEAGHALSLSAEQVTAVRAGAPVVAAALLASNTGAQNATVLNDAIAALAAAGGAGTVALPAGQFNVDGPIYVRGTLPMESGSWVGAILFKGAGINATRLTFSTTKAFVIEPLSTSATGWIDFSDMHLIGPGKGVAGSTLLEYAPQSATPKTSVRVRHDNLYLSDAHTLVALDDCTNYQAVRCMFQRYTYGIGYGYNIDIVTLIQCTFGSSTTDIGSRDETALYYNFRSPAHPTGALSNNAHTYIGCWFMRQLQCANVFDVGSANIKFDSSYFESCVQYASLGQSGSATGPKAMTWDNCHFSIPYTAGESAAKIAVANSTSDSQILLRACRSDSSNGPNGGWIDAGSGPACVVHVDDCILPTGGSATTQATIRFGTKNIVVPNMGRYTFRTGTSTATLKEQFNGGTSGAHREVHAYGGTSSTVFERFAVKPTASESEATGTYPAIIDQVLGGAHYVMWSGYFRAPSVAALPTADAIFRGARAVVDGGGGVADIEYVCLKAAGGSYSWKAVTTG